MCSPDDSNDVENLYEQYISDNPDDWQEYSEVGYHDDEIYYDVDYSDHDDNGCGSSYDDYSDNA